MYSPSKSLHQTTTDVADIFLRYPCCILCMTYLHSQGHCYPLCALFYHRTLVRTPPAAIVTSNDNHHWLLVRTMSTRNRLLQTGCWVLKNRSPPTYIIWPYVDTAFQRSVVAVTDTGLKYFFRYYKANMHSMLPIK